jgi:hypothetical protein
MGPLAQPAFVDEDDGAPLAERFFLSCPVERWQLQPSRRRVRRSFVIEAADE